MGCGILALPAATVAGGLFLSPVINLTIAGNILRFVGFSSNKLALFRKCLGLNAISCTMAIRCKRTYDASKVPPQILSTYSKIAYAGLG